MEYPPLPALKEDRRPRHIRLAHQSFLQGYALYIDEGLGYAMWRHASKSILSIGLQQAHDVVEKLGETFEDRIVIRESTEQEDVMTDEAKLIVLRQERYKGSEIGDLAGYSNAWISHYRDRLTVEKDSGVHFYVVDGKLVDLLEEKGFEVELAGDALGEDVILGKPPEEEVEPVASSDDGQVGAESESAADEQPGASSDGYDGEAYLVAEDWDPAENGIAELPRPVRDYVAEVEEALVDMQEKYDELTEILLDAAHGRGYPEQSEDPIEAVRYLHADSALLGEYRELCRDQEKEIEGLEQNLKETNEELAAAGQKRSALASALNQSRKQVEHLRKDVRHAHQKGRADAEFQVAQKDGEPFEIRRLLEASGVHVIERSADGPAGTCAVQRIRRAHCRLQSARIAGDERAIELARADFEAACAQAETAAHAALRAVRRARLANLFNRLLPV